MISVRYTRISGFLADTIDLSNVCHETENDNRGYPQPDLLAQIVLVALSHIGIPFGHIGPQSFKSRIHAFLQHSVLLFQLSGLFQQFLYLLVLITILCHSPIL